MSKLECRLELETELTAEQNTLRVKYANNNHSKNRFFAFSVCAGGWTSSRSSVSYKYYRSTQLSVVRAHHPGRPVQSNVEEEGEKKEKLLGWGEAIDVVGENGVVVEEGEEEEAAA